LQFLKQFTPTSIVPNTESTQIRDADVDVQAQNQPDVYLSDIMKSEDFNYSVASGVKRNFEQTCSKPPVDGI